MAGDAVEVVRLLERFDLRDGHRPAFEAAAGPLVHAIGREDASLYAQVAVDDTGTHAVLLQAFAGARGLAAQLDDEEVLERRGELQRHAEHDAVRLLGAVPEAQLTPLLTMGLPAELAQPWHGLDRPASAAPGQPAIEVYAEVWLLDPPRYRATVEALADAAASVPGVLCHHTFGLPGGRALVVESYADADAFAAWGGSPAYAEIAKGLRGAVESLSMDVVGDPGPRSRERLARFGARIYRSVAGYGRFERLRGVTP